jgi:glycosyltransferase involved in cell wall biosynthesis
MTALRVGFDTSPLYGPKTGIGFAVEAVRDALRASHDPTSEGHASADVELVEYVLSLRARPAPPTRRMPIPAALAHRCWALGDHPRVDRWLGDVDVVHGTNYVVPPSRLPRVVSVYDCWFLRHPDSANPAVRLAGRVLRRAVAGGAVVHASSHATAEAVRELMPGAVVHTVHLAALPVPAPPATTPIAQLAGCPYVLAIGTLERRKNLPRLVEAFGHLAAQHRDVQLVLAGGDGDDRRAIDAAVDSLGEHASRVMFTGRVTEDVRSWLLHHATVLAYPSLDEGFGFPLLDAMQAGVPVVASDAGSIPEVAGEAALLCAATDVDTLAANLLLAATSPSVRSDLIAAGTRQLHQFSWQRTAQEMIALYRTAIAEHSARTTPPHDSSNDSTEQE